MSVQKQPGASERDERSLEIAKYALFLDLNPTSDSLAVVPLIVPPPHDDAGWESDAPRRGSGLGLGRIFLPWACVEKETYAG